MLSLNEVKPGMVIEYDDHLYQVMRTEFSKQGRGGAILRSKIKDLESGSTIDKTFQGSEKIESVILDRKKYQYLYEDENGFNFMDPGSFEQITLSREDVGEMKDYLSEGIEVQINSYEGKPISLELPIKMDFEVTYTEPGLKGDTKSSTVLKPAKINTGAEIKVPTFIKTGDRITVDTRTGSYVSRA